MPRKPRSLYVRLLWAFVLVTVVAIVLPVYLSRDILYKDKVAWAEYLASAQAYVVRDVLDGDPNEEQLKNIFSLTSDLSGHMEEVHPEADDLSIRYTLMSPDGRVLMDSHVIEASVSDLDKHSDRPEVEDAKSTGFGVAIRHSNSIGIDSIYVAITADNGDIIRVAVPLSNIRNSMSSDMLTYLYFALLVAALCLIMAAVITGKLRARVNVIVDVVSSIANNKSSQRLRDIHFKELKPLALAVNHMADTIEEYVETTDDQKGQLEAILNSMQEGVLVLDHQGFIRIWNNSMQEMLPRVAESEGRPIIEAIPYPAVQDRVDEILSAEVSNNDLSEAIEFEMPAGRFLIAHFYSPAAKNEKLGAVIVIYDSTELTRLEGVRKDFVANVSHELRTPLTVISGYAETLMSSSDLQEEYKKFASVIYKHSSALAKIVSDLLELARIENENEEIVLLPSFADVALERAMLNMQDELKKNNLQVEVDLNATKVLCNVDLLSQVFRNLLENACRYSPKDGLITISSVIKEDNMLFIVTDNGPGIPEEALSRIFERFYQVTKERNSGSAGIGLAICRNIIQRQNGKVWAESPYKGASTAMLFTLPLANKE